MFDLLKRFVKGEEGLGTVEIVILVAVLVAIALLFGKTIKGMVERMLKTVSSSGDGALKEINE